MADLNALVDPAQRKLLDELADALDASCAVAIVADSGAYAAEVADAFASGLAPPADQRRFAPDKGRYTAAELDAVVAAAALRPERRNVCVLAAADTLDAVSASRLLKTVEDPPAPTVFILALPSRAELPPALAGRVAHTVRLPAPPAELVTARIDQLPDAQSRELVALCAPRSELAVALAAARDVDKVIGALTKLAALTPTTAPGDADLDVFDAFPAVAVFDIVTLCLDRFEAAVRGLLAHDPGALALVASVEHARSLLQRHASPVAVLLSVLTRATPALAFPGRSRLRAWAV